MTANNNKTSRRDKPRLGDDSSGADEVAPGCRSESRPQASLQLWHRRIVLQIDILVLDTPPQPFDEDVVQCPPTTVHADAHTRLFQTGCEVDRRELHPLIRVEDVRVA